MGPWTTSRKEWVEQEKKVARDLFQHVHGAEIPWHVDPQERAASTVVFLLKEEIKTKSSDDKSLTQTEFLKKKSC